MSLTRIRSILGLESEPDLELGLRKPEKEKCVIQAPKTLYIVGTGGTIAGAADSSVSSNYESGKLDIGTLMKQIPDLKRFQDIQALDLFHIDSSDITIENWLTLAKKVNALLTQPNTKGVVITHGTDTLEETAYFLDLVIKSDKPVILVGSMRASTSLSPDGPLNLFNALAVADSPEAIGKGVLVVMNDTIFDARDVTKSHTTRVSTFTSPNSGPIGTVYYGDVEFSQNPIRKHTTETPFDISTLEALPKVEVIYECAGSDGALLRLAIEHLKPQGIVIAGPGDGNIVAKDKALMEAARESNITIIRSSHTGSGKVTYDYVDQLDSRLGLVAGDNLSPQKARILLMLTLTLPEHQPKNVQSVFMRY